MKKINKFFVLSLGLGLCLANIAQSQCLTAPFTESFGSGLQPPCVLISATSGGPWDFNGISWNTSGCSTAPTDHTGTSGDFASMDHSGTDAGVILEFDTIDVTTVANPYLSFFYYMCGAGYSPLNILVVETFNGTSWVFVDSIQEGFGAWTEYNYDLTTYKFGTNLLKVRFRAESGGSSSDFYGDQALDDISITQLPSCIKPTALSTSSIAATSANINWTENQSATSWQIEWGAAGFPQGTGTKVIVTTKPHTLSGLSANTAYDYYVRSICAVGDTSGWSSASSFKTLCNAFSVPFTETFNSGSSTESCWTVIDVNSDGDAWDMNYISNPFEGDQSAMMYTDFNTGFNDDYLISPGISLTGNERIRYYYRVQSTSEPNDYEILVSTTGINTTDFTDTILTDTVSSTSYLEQIINLNAYTGTIYLAFHIPNGGLDGWRLYIDSVTFEAIPSCPKPINLSSGSYTVSSANLNWTELGSATTWEIEWDTTGFLQGTGTKVVTTTMPYTLSGLSAITAYDFYVRSICAVGDTSGWSSVSSFQTPCNVFIAPFSEDFTASTTSLPSCWAQSGLENWLFRNTGTGHIGNGGTLSGSTSSNGYFAWVDDSSPHNTSTSLISPLIDVSGLTSPRLTFYTISDNESDPNGNVDFHVDVHDGAQWNDSIFFSDTNTLNGAWEKINVDLSGLTFTGPIQIRFVVDEVNGTGFDDDRAIDDVVVEDCPSTTGNITLTACDSYTVPSGDETYTVSGTYMDTIPNVGGCDSLLTIILTIDNSTAVSFTETACDSYTVPSGDETYTVSGTYMDTIPNVRGCDSLMTITLTINNSTTGSITVSACDSYTVPSGDETYLVSGTYMDTVPTIAGCDSIITINLTINTVDVSTTTSSPTITSNATGATSYQWLDCNNGNTPIAGATGSSFTATANGDYAVEVKENGCTDTSSCVNITGVGIADNIFNNQVNVYPNPNNGIVNIDLGSLTNVSIRVLNVNGKLITNKENINSSNYQFELNEGGIYFIIVRSQGREEQYKLTVIK